MPSIQRERDIQYIKNCIQDLGDPYCGMPEWAFNHCSYSRWAGYELLGMIERNPDVPVIILAKRLTNMFDHMSRQKPRTADLFTIAKNFVEDIHEVLVLSN